MLRALILAAILVLLPMAAHAQTVAGIDNLLTQFQTVTSSWGGPLQNLMRGTFGTLAVIDLAYCVGYRTLLSRGDMTDFMYALLGEVVFLSFFSWLLTTFSTTGPLIIQTFQYAAKQAGGIPTQPNGIFAEGLKIASTIVHQVSILHPGNAVAMVICGLAVLLCFAWICASMVIIIVESYFIVSAGQILTMFGGSHFTYEMAINLLRTCVGIGLKIYAMQLIASVGSAFVATWVAQATTVTFDGILIEIGETLVLAAIVAGVPHMFDRLAGGVGSTGAGSLMAAGGALAAAGSIIGKSVVKALSGAAGFGVATAVAGKLAGAQMGKQIAAGGGPTTTEGRIGSLLGGTAKNLASAKMEDIGRGLRGQRSNLGQPVWRMASAMGEQRRLIDEGSNRPQPPAGP